jgi:hypothetical protein
VTTYTGMGFWGPRYFLPPEEVYAHGGRLGQPRVGRAGAGVAVRERRGQDEHAIGNRLVSVVFRFEFEGLAGQSESDPMSVHKYPDTAGLGGMAGGTSGGRRRCWRRPTTPADRCSSLLGAADSTTKPPRGFYENECFLWFSRTRCVLIRRN